LPYEIIADLTPLPLLKQCLNQDPKKMHELGKEKKLAGGGNQGKEYHEAKTLQWQTELQTPAESRMVTGFKRVSTFHS
jgi:hypothetical protein